MTDLRIIALLPVRNEDWILPAFLSSVAGVVDRIVAADDGSTDGTRRQLEQAGAVLIDPGAHKGLEMEQTLKPKLLNAGREAGGTHFLFLDADEALSGPAQRNLRAACARLSPGDKLAMEWITLWKSPRRFRNDGSVWARNFKDFVFADDGTAEFPRGLDHRMPRTPGITNDPNKWIRMPSEQAAVLHFQFAAWERAQIKQAWYRCSELIRDPRNAHGINLMFRHRSPAQATLRTRCPRRGSRAS